MQWGDLLPKNQRASLLQIVCKSNNVINFEIHLKIKDNIVAKKASWWGLLHNSHLGFSPCFQ